MTYYYEALNDISFQKFAQSLVVSMHPETICLPVRQPDGGRDAFFYHAALDRKNFVVFQIKFSKTPNDKTERDAIDSLIKSEEKKVTTLIEKGATHYYLVTNIQGTAHLGSGSIDTVNEILTKRFKIPCFVWWRDDLDARLDNASDIKWSYPEICRATDVLQFLIKRPEFTSDLEAARAITAYMSKQHGDDRDVKFKQVELKRKITDLFVDSPIGHKGAHREGKRVQRAHAAEGTINRYLEQLKEDLEFETEEDHPFNHSGLAAGFLLHMPFGQGVSRLVLEGAPGQGKSTVTQFLCQVNRLKLLPTRRTELSSVGDVHSEAPTRAPFRVDLRDYAAWVAGRHPYAKAGEVTSPEEGQRSLESFLTMQIAWHSGGLNLTQHDLLDFLVRAHSVVVLDGFDEVADIATRARVVEEICAAADRLDAHALSLQIIVTSRPAAFANSPGFPEEDWIHLELNDLKWSNIKIYKEKWSDAQDLTDTEKASLTATLEEKLQQPHLRDLSRNPMQLAILLQLMHVQGAALPDKRTALYEEYMKIFLNREVEKKQIVGDHRELILSIHGLLAWVLQVQAETGQGSGSITMDALRKEVVAYLESEEHEPGLAENLLKGTVERVGALVSRVQGTFEFEVQPLREYFAARHLHKTAPYSPPGSAKRGTRPDRFAALAGNSYWTNVTRFFCGFYDVGELPSLVDGLMAVGERNGYRLITQPRRLALMLLSDYVFTQSPKSMRRLIYFITKEPDFERLSGADFGQSQRGMILPKTAGGKVLFEVCAEKLRSEKDANLRSALRQVMARNGDRVGLKNFWINNSECETRGNAKMLTEVRELELTDEFTSDEITAATDGNIQMQIHWLAEANLHDHIVDDPALYDRARSEFFKLEIYFPFHRSYRNVPSNPLVVLSELLHPHVMSECFTMPPEHTVGFGRRDYFRRDFLKRDASECSERRQDPFEQFAYYVVDLMDISPEIWRSDLEPWEKLVDRGFQEAAEGRLFSLIAMLSTAVSCLWKRLEDDREIKSGINLQECLNQDKVQASWDSRGFTPTAGLVRRLFFSKGKGNDASWWQTKLRMSDGEERMILLAALVCWGNAGVIQNLSKELSEACDDLDPDRWSWFWNVSSLIISVAGSQIEKLNDNWFVKSDELTERLAVVLTRRLLDGGDRRKVARKCFWNYRGGDGRILQAAAEWELLSEPYADIDWEFAEKLSIQARENGVQYLFSHSHARHSVDVPVDVAERVLEECGKHDWQFVSLCERSLGSFVAQKAKRVSTVAEEEDWFLSEVGK